jgi:hypothetical protein
MGALPNLHGLAFAQGASDEVFWWNRGACDEVSELSAWSGGLALGPEP